MDKWIFGGGTWSVPVACMPWAKAKAKVIAVHEW